MYASILTWQKLRLSQGGDADEEESQYPARKVILTASASVDH
jgi:hypothetical protein